MAMKMETIESAKDVGSKSELCMMKEIKIPSNPATVTMHPTKFVVCNYHTSILPSSVRRRSECFKMFPASSSHEFCVEIFCASPVVQVDEGR